MIQAPSIFVLFKLLLELVDVFDVFRDQYDIGIAEVHFIVYGEIQGLGKTDWYVEVAFAVVNGLGQVPLSVPNQLNSHHR